MRFIIQICYHYSDQFTIQMQNISRSFIHDPRARILYVLLLIWIFAVFQNPGWKNIVFPLFSIAFFSILDLGFLYFKSKKLYYPFSSLVSGLLIGLIIHPSSGIFAIILACLFGFISKQFIKYKNHHIFNPAAFGVVISSLILNFSISWWSVAPGKIFILLSILSVLVLWKLKRIYMPITFLSGYFIFLALFQGIKPAISLTIDGTVIFFAFIMLTEPMTSSISGFWKWAFGLVVLSGVVISYVLKLSFTDPLLFSLLFANLLVRITNK